MRRPQPWYWEKRNAWYVQVNKKQVRLGEDKDAAYREYYRLMAADGNLTDAELGQATLADVMDAFIEGKARCRAKTRDSYAYHLAPLVEALGRGLFAGVKPIQVTRVIDGRAGWGEGTRHVAFVIAKGAFSWAREAGFSDRNSLAGAENPYIKGSRRRGMTVEEFNTLIGDCRDKEWRFALRVLRDTGLRPGELRTIAAKHLDPRLPIARLAPAEHKTGRRSGRDRIIILPEDLMVELRKLAGRHPAGPIIRNQHGDPWTEDAMIDRIRRAKRKHNLAKDLCCYSTRHAFLTRMLDGGVDLARAAKIAGHANTNTIQTTYYHPDLEKMVGEVQRMADEANRDLGRTNPWF